MIIGRVIGNLVSVVKDSTYEGFKMLIVQEMNIDGSYAKNFHICADLIGVGVDETVMVTCGTSSRTPKRPMKNLLTL